MNAMFAGADFLRTQIIKLKKEKRDLENRLMNAKPRTPNQSDSSLISEGEEDDSKSAIEYSHI
jgi:hypothetical protein